MCVGLRYLITTLAGLLLSTYAARAELRVAVTVKPVHSLVAGVMAGIGEPHLIVKGAASPHYYTMKPSDATALQRATIVFRIGGTFERFLDTAIKSGNASAEIVSLGDNDSLRRLKIRDGKAWGGATHDGHNHRTDVGTDPHIWLDPENAIQMIATIAQTLGFAEPSRMLHFARNAAALAARIKTMQAGIRATLTPVRGRPFLVYHDAFQYFETAFGLTAVGAVSLDETRSPGAKRIRALKQGIAARNVVCIFAEPQFEPRIIATLIEGTAVRRGVLDPIGADIAAGPDAYFEMMQHNAKAFADCLK